MITCEELSKLAKKVYILDIWDEDEQCWKTLQCNEKFYNEYIKIQEQHPRSKLTIKRG